MSALRRFGLIIPALVAALIFGCGGGGPFRSAGLVYKSATVATDDQGNQTVSVGVLAWHGIATITTEPVPAATAAAIQTKLIPGNLVDWIPGKAPGIAEVPVDPNQTFNVILSKGSATAAQFNLAKYGASVTRHEGEPGPMVAAGWAYNKTWNKITVGDGQIVMADQAGRPYDKP
ncbi:MAG TPA: hypothetical protein VGJ35_15715, partial [Burkholderiaceae bacterium]